MGLSWLQCTGTVIVLGVRQSLGKSSWYWVTRPGKNWSPWPLSQSHTTHTHLCNKTSDCIGTSLCVTQWRFLVPHSWLWQRDVISVWKLSVTSHLFPLYLRVTRCGDRSEAGDVLMVRACTVTHLQQWALQCEVGLQACSLQGRGRPTS